MSFFDRIERAANRIHEKVHETASEIKAEIKAYSRKRKAPTAEDAISKLKETEELLTRKQEHFEEKIAQEVENAKKYAKTNKKMAISALRRKKQYEIELGRIDGTLSKLEAQRVALENVGMNQEVVDVLSGTNETLKNANKKLDIDKVADLMDQIADDLAMSDELNQAISRPIGDVADEDDLMAELEQLQADSVKTPELPESSKKRAKAGANSIDLPDVPAGPITRSRASREKIRKMDTMDELKEWAAAN
ncbi:hypothetical protein WR25_16561 [Diploscapter pachys]|uniref:SNF7 family protein n=1 Tax=Diploscapter pachys TaxID=2018661 RepID=A0A2A2LDF4_9BILA|nr:hypothetical protein WR25_16561 [Diploscapter pachys]